MLRLENTQRAAAIAVALGAFTALMGCRGQESELPPVHLNHNMDTQEKGKAYRADTTGLFTDGRVMRPPVEGTLAQGQLVTDVHFDDGLDENGDPVKKFPESVKVNGELTDAFRARGEQRYNIYCQPCHGLQLDGKGTVAANGADGKPRLQVAPPSLHDARLKTMPIGQMYKAIKYGVNEGNMGSYAAQIPVQDRWAIIAYVRQQQKAKDSTVEEEGGQVLVVAKVDTASADHGQQLYAAKACVGCHSLDGSRLVGPSFKGLWGRKEKTSAGEVDVDVAYLTESIKAPNAKVVEGYPPVMPMIPLSDLEIESLILYIKTVQ
jgi:mono/diheme cytochrome c family protein